MNIKAAELQISLLMVGFLAYLSLPALYWWWLKHNAVPRAEDWMIGLWMLWFAGMVCIPLGLYLLVRAWQLMRKEIISGR